MVKAPSTGVKTADGQQKSPSKEEKANSSTEKPERRCKKSSKRHYMNNNEASWLQGHNKKSDSFSRIGWRTYINTVFALEPMNAMRKLYGSICSQASGITSSKNFRHNICSRFIPGN